jgi:p-hydroxybenzoate 3-monooxygenase
VGIIGAGPAGLTLARLLQLQGVDSLVIEARTRQYVEQRVRAGVLEQGTADLMRQIGADDRMKDRAIEHQGIELRFDGRSHRIDLYALTGRSIFIYGQNELLRDLTDLRLATGGELLFEAEATGVDGIDTNAPRIHFRKAGEEHEIVCKIVAGCDGFHGISRRAIPPDVRNEFERAYPFAWLGVLVQAPPPSQELIYTHHQRGFALLSMRSRQISRWYLQCNPAEQIADWSGDKIFHELRARLAGAHEPFPLPEGRILQKGITGMRSFVTEPMQHGRLFLAGDAAHIVPPTGAKGLNLAVSDTAVLARAVAAFCRTGSTELLNGYSETCLRRVWNVQRFAWWMTSMLHRFPDGNLFDSRRQLAELTYVTTSHAAATTLAENYAGLPMN